MLELSEAVHELEVVGFVNKFLVADNVQSPDVLENLPEELAALESVVRNERVAQVHWTAIMKPKESSRAVLVEEYQLSSGE